MIQPGAEAKTLALLRKLAIDMGTTTRQILPDGVHLTSK